ncbi:MAG: globin domain-containing protein [Bacteriovoracaceae bacterium]
MSSLDIALIKESFEGVIEVSEEAMSYFYNQLFEKYPQVQPLFADIDMKEQQDNLFSALMYIVDNIEKPNVVLPFIEKMGARHANYGVEESHFPIIGFILLDTYSHFFGEKWTDDLREHWLKAYALIASHMIKGMRDKAKVA